MQVFLEQYMLNFNILQMNSFNFIEILWLDIYVKFIVFKWLKEKKQ